MPDFSWQDRNVFVTGCTGLLGSWLTIELVGKGANVTGLVRDQVPRSNLRWSGFHDTISVVHGELEDYLLLERALNEYEIDTVFHLGAQTIVSIANANPLSTFEANIRGTWNVLEACRRVPYVKAVVVASSDKAYGHHDDLPYDETAPLVGAHPYDVSKSCADLIARAYFRTYQLPVCATRCGNLYGGGDLNFNRIVPGTIRSILREQRPVIRSDGTFVRDYFYVNDCVQAYLLLAERMRADTAIHGEAFNFSNELQISVLELVQKIGKLMQRTDLEPLVLSEVKGEIRHQYLSARKAHERLGWQPAYTVEQGLTETIRWYSEFLRGSETPRRNADAAGE